MIPDELTNRFTYHPPKDDATRLAHEAIRSTCLHLVNFLDSLLPRGREKSHVVTKIEEAMFWANAAIARQREKT